MNPDWPTDDPDVRLALERALADGSWGRYRGPHLPALESALATAHDGTNVVTCASGTLAVEAALRAADVGASHDVIMPAYDYEANFLTAHTLGATPVLVDTEPTTGAIDPACLAAAITPRAKAVVVSHLHGGLARMRAIRDVCDSHGLRLIEDAAQCPGAVVDGRPAGTWGDLGVLSFGGSKLLTAGRGGAVLTAHADLARRLRLWLGRGVQQWAVLSEIQAIVLLPQLAKLASRNEQRWRRVRELETLVAAVPGLTRFANQPADSPAFYKVGFHFDAAKFGASREAFVRAMRAEGVAFDAGFRASHVGRSPSRFRAPLPLPNAERLHREVVILHHPVLLGTDADIRHIAATIEKTYCNAGRLDP